MLEEVGNKCTQMNFLINIKNIFLHTNSFQLSHSHCFVCIYFEMYMSSGTYLLTKRVCLIACLSPFTPFISFLSVLFLNFFPSYLFHTCCVFSLCNPIILFLYDTGFKIFTNKLEEKKIEATNSSGTNVRHVCLWQRVAIQVENRPLIAKESTGQ